MTEIIDYSQLDDADQQVICQNCGWMGLELDGPISDGSFTCPACGCSDLEYYISGRYVNHS